MLRKIISSKSLSDYRQKEQSETFKGLHWSKDRNADKSFASAKYSGTFLGQSCDLTTGAMCADELLSKSVKRYEPKTTTLNVANALPLGAIPSTTVHNIEASEEGGQMARVRQI